MLLSLSEVEALARKAMRGAGASWGLAEEAGKATRWLASRGHPAPGLLAGLLADWPGEGAVGDVTRGWRGASGRLCPIRAGSILSDHASLPGFGKVTFARVAQPALMLPFAASAGVALEWSGDAVSDVVARKKGAVAPPPTLSTSAIDAATLAALEGWAHRTYVPASDASRAGAGSALSDND
ncbi:DUF3726 domain-containing protein [Rhodobacteraceae bacterium NNCM2]|nr:DUF3726 domain-containing protein [Coraliihabitans acroporae]